jgi:hypothetical protein
MRQEQNELYVVFTICFRVSGTPTTLVTSRQCIIMNWLLLFIPITIGLEYLAPERHLYFFLGL